jgi:hypothetical protein
MVMSMGILMVKCIPGPPFRQEISPMRRLPLLSLDRFCSLEYPVPLVLGQLRDPILLMVGIFAMPHHQRLVLRFAKRCPTWTMKVWMQLWMTQLLGH